jgi:hypothetical protein
MWAPSISLNATENLGQNCTLIKMTKQFLKFFLFCLNPNYFWSRSCRFKLKGVNIAVFFIRFVSKKSFFYSDLLTTRIPTKNRFSGIILFGDDNSRTHMITFSLVIELSSDHPNIVIINFCGFSNQLISKSHGHVWCINYLLSKPPQNYSH